MKCTVNLEILQGMSGKLSESGKSEIQLQIGLAG